MDRKTVARMLRNRINVMKPHGVAPSWEAKRWQSDDGRHDKVYLRSRPIGHITRCDVGWLEFGGSFESGFTFKLVRKATNKEFVNSRRTEERRGADASGHRTGGPLRGR